VRNAVSFRIVILICSALLAVVLYAIANTRERHVATAPEPWYPSVNGDGHPVHAVFQSRVPCLDEQALATPDCQKVKVALVLYHDPQTRAPSTYLLGRVCVDDGNGRIVNAGTWTVGSGTNLGPHARVYRLDANAPPDFRSYWAISGGILFVLDREQRPRVGDAGYGYALSRTN
jgi:hypothetical protein